MARAAWITLVLVIALGFIPVSAMAAEHGGTEHGGATTAESTDSSSAATTDAPADAPSDAPADAPADAQAFIPAADTTTAPIPALKPIVITFSGELSSIDANVDPAAITVQDRYGVRKEIALPADAKISQGAEAKAAADLKVGDKLTVEYTYDVATGKRTAQSILIGEAAVSKPAA